MNVGSLIDEKDQSEKLYRSFESVVQYSPRSASLKVKVAQQLNSIEWEAMPKMNYKIIQNLYIIYLYIYIYIIHICIIYILYIYI